MGHFADNEIFQSYAFWTAILVLKMLAMSMLTAFTRMKNKVWFWICCGNFPYLLSPPHRPLLIPKIPKCTVSRLILPTMKWNAFEGIPKLYKLKVANNWKWELISISHRAHLNDLENVIPLIVTGLVYTVTNPPVALAISLFRAAAIIRIVHTIVYAVYPLPQPARAIAFFVPLAITGYMAVKTMMFFI